MGLPSFLIPRTATTNSLQRLRAAAYVPIFGSTTIILGFKKEHFCQGSIRLHTSRAEIVGDMRRASDIWSAPVGGDSRAGIGLSVSTNRVTSKMPPAIRASATRVFVMARSAFIYQKRGRGGRGRHQSAGVALRFLASRQARPIISSRQASPPRGTIALVVANGPHAKGSGVSRGSCGSLAELTAWQLHRSGPKTSKLWG